MSRVSAVAGISDHNGWAIVMCVVDSQVLDRRRVELVEPGLPCMPHHHEGQKLPIDEAAALVETVRESAVRCAGKALDELPQEVSAIAIRQRPKLPPTTAERITNYWAQTRADPVMYRNALAQAADARGWAVHEYETKSVLAEASSALGISDITEHLDDIGRALGAPWRKDHRLATAAAIAAQSR